MNTCGREKQKPTRKLHIGCANIAPPGWINLDGSWNAWAARLPGLRQVLGALRVIPREQASIEWPKNLLVHDVRKGLPFPDESLSAVYASHLLEHLLLQEALRLLGECFRVLDAGGILRLVVPDLRAMILDYLKPSGSNRPFENILGYPADKLCRGLGMRSTQVQQGSLLYRSYSSLKDFHTHKWMYDADSLRGHLTAAGFVCISSKRFLESSIPGIEEVERKERFGDHAGICLEGMKPA